MKRTDFYFDLPEELIAQTPLERRDASRLLHLDPKTGAVEHRHFYDLPAYLRAGDSPASCRRGCSARGKPAARSSSCCCAISAADAGSV